MPKMPKIPEDARLVGVLYERPGDAPGAVNAGLVIASGVPLVKVLSVATAVLNEVVRQRFLELWQEQDEDVPLEGEHVEGVLDCAREGT